MMWRLSTALAAERLEAPRFPIAVTEFLRLLVPLYYCSACQVAGLVNPFLDIYFPITLFSVAPKYFSKRAPYRIVSEQGRGKGLTTLSLALGLVVNSRQISAPHRDPSLMCIFQL